MNGFTIDGCLWIWQSRPRMEIPTPILVEHPESSPPSTPPPPRKTFRYALAGVCAVLLLGVGIGIRRNPAENDFIEFSSLEPPEVLQLPTPTPQPAGRLFSGPTPQTRWQDLQDPTVYMPTASGRVASAHYGSTRTGSNGLPRFHEGVDVSPIERDPRQRPLDPILAIADGTVAYVSRRGGNSTYGIYIVLTHEDEVGTVYSLYSHLASVESGIQQGAEVSRGQKLGVMGWSSSIGIPVSRSHLHLEMGLKLNGHYSRLSRAQKLSNPHGNYHGFNLAGFNPSLLLQNLQNQDPVRFSYQDAIRSVPPAWRLLIRGTRRPEFFDRYPSLWTDTPRSGSAFWIDVSDGGVPLAGGFATQDDARLLQGGHHRVLEVDREVLGRNGRRHVVTRNGKWVLGRNGEKWKEILLYRP